MTGVPGDNAIKLGRARGANSGDKYPDFTTTMANWSGCRPNTVKSEILWYGRRRAARTRVSP